MEPNTQRRIPDKLDSAIEIPIPHSKSVVSIARTSESIFQFFTYGHLYGYYSIEGNGKNKLLTTF